MRAGLVLLLIAAGVMAVQAGASRNLLQSSAQCPIDNCLNNAGACVYNSRVNQWKCFQCVAPMVPNSGRTACVCPAGQYPIVGTNKCAPCKIGFYCPKGTQPDQSTAKACPKNMITLKPGATSQTDCYNKPGYKYVKTATGVRADACEADTYSPGLAKQVQCTRCPSGFNTDPKLVPGTQTSSDVCVAPPGKYVTGDSTAPCPKGEYSDTYDMTTSCTTCASLFDDAYSEGITTATSGSTSADDCRYVEPGYAAVTEKKTTILSVPAAGYKLGGARLCPQKYFCPGGDIEDGVGTDPSGADLAAADVGKTGNEVVAFGSTGIPIKCNAAGTLWTQDEGAKSFDECVAPPGYSFTAGDASTQPTTTVCATGMYKEEWDRSSQCRLCSNAQYAASVSAGDYWMSQKTIYIAELDATTGLVNRQIATRGSTDSCFIQKGMGTVTTRSGNSAISTLTAVFCPNNTYGIVADKKFGRVATPCTPCPLNTVTSLANATELQVQTYITDPDSGATSANPNLNDGYGFYSVDACLVPAGYGYYGGASQPCPKGTYNAGNNQSPCIQCPTGTTTDTSATNSAVTDCTLYNAGYGNVAGVVAMCALGTYMPQDTNATATPNCIDCPTHRWSPALGASDDGYNAAGVGCTLCSAGYGDDTYDPNLATPVDPTCGACENGLYGDLTRITPKCQVCPITRTYTYAYNGVPDVVEPQATSPDNGDAKSLDACVTDFQQVIDGTFSLTFDPAAISLTVGVDIENIQSCVQACRESVNCSAITFNYDPDSSNTQPCKAYTPTHDDTQDYGIAWKTLPSIVNAQSVSDAKAKAMGSGLYSFWKGDDATNIDAANKPASELYDNVADIQTCMDKCTNVDKCAGIAFTGLNPDGTLDAAAGNCQLIVGVVSPGSSLRSLTKTVYTRMKFDY